ncbi:carboxymuconolactone decarboxylase [Fomitiporia mediterranea MF3/22]|uniref:carboxymuconolactone decarboxylase n=1 Tax=Fomitiporia mediterranea (strain MF3/22) TaxID=694068 RepID=UPI0004408C82|nr:carboxymuconolactone decarboxylase [Fomitiporia mediterranea MF3/22]EJD02489.1 carboxymuconolactone decarboxylase [Fomitiporia mediterranea MF3/22]
MPRVPYVLPKRGESAIADSIRLRRKGEELTELDGVLLNAPTIAEGYNALLKAVRTSSSLPDDIRELIILRVAALNSASYEWIQHEPIARKAGLSTSQLLLVRDISVVPALLEHLNADAATGLSPLHAAAMVYTDYVTRFVEIPQSVFNNLRSKLENDQQMLELTTTAAAYNMVSRILVALDVGDKAEEKVPVPH